jgi:glycine cleavage system H protein
MDLNALHYAESHEWAQITGDICTVGITAFAIEQLTDITYIELPKVGKKVEKGKPFGTIESVKSANDLYAPVSGEIIEVNQAVANDPMMLSQDAYDKGWMIRIKVTGTPDTTGLLDKSAYDAFVATQGH